jgi:hypothetical protein
MPTVSFPNPQRSPSPRGRSLLGAPGAFLAMPITIFVAVMFGTFPETRWLASLMGVSSPATDTLASSVGVERPEDEGQSTTPDRGCR